MEIKKVRIVGMNIVGTKVEKNPLKEAPTDQGLAYIGQTSTKVTRNDLLLNDDKC